MKDDDREAEAYPVVSSLQMLSGHFQVTGTVHLAKAEGVDLGVKGHSPPT